MCRRVVFSLNSKMNNAIKKCFVLLLIIVQMFLSLLPVMVDSVDMACVVSSNSSYSVHGFVATNVFERLKDIVGQFFYSQKEKKVDDRKILVYPGGYPLGFTLECEGVIIVSLGEVLTKEGVNIPVYNKDINVGDVLYSIDGKVLTSANDLVEIVNQKGGEDVRCIIRRGGKEIVQTLTPALEESTNIYRIGLWVRDNGAGVGTLTFVRQDNNRFGALGHPVCDVDTGKKMPVCKGNIYKCNIVGYNKGTRGNPGELRGLFLRSGETVGSLDVNDEYGVYGEVGSKFIEGLGKPVEVGFRDSVKTGKAKILCTIDGNQPKEYDIEIVKLSYQNASDKKSMVIRVTDKRLIEQTGGIVQGMSGSPIIQEGKLVGAVTHVFVSDPTKGFGVYIDWMIDN